jgi:hypothetical protein
MLLLFAKSLRLAESEQLQRETALSKLVSKMNMSRRTGVAPLPGSLPMICRSGPETTCEPSCGLNRAKVRG